MMPTISPSMDEIAPVIDNSSTNSSSNSHSTSSGRCVVIEWDDLINDNIDLSTIMEEAYGAVDSIGILAIRNVPGFVNAKQEFFQLAYPLAVQLPAEYRDTQLTDPISLYNSGWSYGKEKLGIHKPPDISKGSYYYNPMTDTPGTEDDRRQYPISYPTNRWPENDALTTTSHHLLPGFRDKAITIGRLLKDVTVHVSKHIDRLAQRKVPSYPSSEYYLLYNQLKDTEKVKARLLYYYPLPPTPPTTTTTSTEERKETETAAEDSWIGWHNDSGFLTALAGDMYVNHETGEVYDECPDETAGLYVVTRNDETIRVTIPSDCCAVQIGECTQIITGGAVRATPHCVRGITNHQTMTTNTNSNSIARVSLPCFVDTPPTFPLIMPTGSGRQDVLDASMNTNKVPPLHLRWHTDGMTFGDFLQTTFSMYYDWK